MLVLCLFICVISLTACDLSKKDVLHLGINAVIIDIDDSSKTITVRDSEEEGLLGDSCLIDCSSLDMIYCDYDTHKVADISFEDLQYNDEIILSIRSSEIENFKKEEDGSSIKVEQLQLSTQRIEL